MIYTTYFDNIENLSDNVIPVAISITVPRWYRGRRYKKLRPYSYDMVDRYKKTRDEVAYTCVYNATTLYKLNPQDTYEELMKDIPDGFTVALVCYESIGFCHRELVRNWFNQAGIECREW